MWIGGHYPGQNGSILADTLRSVQLRIADIYIYYILCIVRAKFVLITRKEGGA